jgi:RecA-family ATPase
MTAETETRPQIIGRGILPIQGKAILGGSAKSNKSFVALNVGICLAKGVPLFKAAYPNGTPVYPVMKPWRVLLIEQEIGEDGLRKRLRGIVSEEQALGAPFYIRSKDTQFRLDTSEGLAKIEEDIANIRPDVLILDPLSKFHGLDENSATEMGKVMRVGDYLIQKYGCAILYIHHTGLAAFDKENPRRGGARLRGSSAIFADVDTFVEVNRLSVSHTAEPTLKLEFELRQGAPIPPSTIKRTREGKIQFLGEENPL